MITHDVLPVRRSGAQTRQQAQQVALHLFTKQGYEATSLREIADELGINKASLYYYFDSKEAILRSLFDDRGTEATDLLTWLRAQSPSPQLLEDAVLRWVDSFTSEKLTAIRFMAANPLVIRALSDSGGDRVGASLTAIVAELAALLPDAADQDVVLLRMGVLSINAAVQAAAGTELADADIIAAARRAARALVHEIGGAR